MVQRPPYLRVVGPNDKPPGPNLMGPRPIGPDDAALLLRNAHGNPTCEVVFGWNPSDPHQEVLFVLKTLAEAVQKSQDAGEKPRPGFFSKIRDKLHDLNPDDDE